MRHRTHVILIVSSLMLAVSLLGCGRPETANNEMSSKAQDPDKKALEEIHRALKEPVPSAPRSEEIPTPTPADKACIVPKVEGLDQAAAAIAIAQLGLQPVESIGYDSNTTKGTVLSQKPAAETKLHPCQGEVTIIISLGPMPLPRDERTIPRLRSEYKGTIHNTTFNREATLALTSIVENQGNISGQVIIGPGLGGSGRFTGTINANGSVNFEVNSIFFKGSLHTNGSFSGTYSAPGLNQEGTWQTTPVGDERPELTHLRLRK